VSRGKVFLRERAHVHGNLTTAATVERQNATLIDGTKTENATLVFKPFDIVTAFPDVAQTAITIAPDRVVTTPVAPGYYAGLTVNSRSTITLKTGSYFLDNFQIEPNATLRLDDSAGPIFIYIRQSFNFKGLLVRTQTGHPQLLVGYLGTSSAFVGGPFRGTILAPNAEINLATVGATGHEGAFFGKVVRVAADVQVVHRPFSWIIGNVTIDKPAPCQGDSVNGFPAHLPL